MARAARQSGADPDDEDYEEFEEMLEQAESAQVRVAHTYTSVMSAIGLVIFNLNSSCHIYINPTFCIKIELNLFHLV